MITISAWDFRRQLSRYLSQSEAGDTISIIRNSRLIAVLQPPYRDPLEELVSPEAADYEALLHLQTPVGRVTFRRGSDQDSNQLLTLFGTGTDAYDLLGVRSYSHSLGGDFWVATVAERTGETIIAAAGFTLPMDEQAQLQRFKVELRYETFGVGQRLRQLLAMAAIAKGYRTDQLLN